MNVVLAILGAGLLNLSGLIWIALILQATQAAVVANYSKAPSFTFTVGKSIQALRIAIFILGLALCIVAVLS